MGDAYLLADAHPLYCDALTGLVTRQDLLTAGDGSAAAQPVTAVVVHRVDQALAWLRQAVAPPRMVLIDLGLLGPSWLKGIDPVLSASGRSPVVALADRSGLASPADLELVGVAGLILKTSPAAAVAQSLTTIARGPVVPGRFVLCDQAAEGAASPQSGSASGDPRSAVGDDRLAQLTPQQIRVLELVCRGKPNKIIAFELAISESTVKAHITAILRKLGVHSRTQAVLEVRAGRLLEHVA